MNEWEAKYRALLMGIDNISYIENAEKLVRTVLTISATSPMTFEQIFWAMRDMISLQQGQETIAKLS